MNLAAQRQVALERDLRAAISNQQFALHYQPQVALDSGSVVCVEALLRWTADDGRSVPPDQFIPIAESAGLLVEIGAWVLARACGDLAVLRSRGHHNLRVAVNLSASQFRDPKLIARIEGALADADLPPDALELEITESTLIEDIDDAVRTLEALRGMGITVAVDDFGIGYSSLNYLKRLPLDVLKIDRSFVRDIETDSGDRSIVDAILAVAQSMSSTPSPSPGNSLICRRAVVCRGGADCASSDTLHQSPAPVCIAGRSRFTRCVPCVAHRLIQG
jgi:EAL domain-containing protein (putative c-di-GMP-specific phosphodiesterase class I)